MKWSKSIQQLQIAIFWGSKNIQQLENAILPQGGLRGLRLTLFGTDTTVNEIVLESNAQQ